VDVFFKHGVVVTCRAMSVDWKLENVLGCRTCSMHQLDVSTCQECST